jgi:hypothetical protein
MYDDVTREAEQFLYREARLLNERRVPRVARALYQFIGDTVRVVWATMSGRL